MLVWLLVEYSNYSNKHRFRGVAVIRREALISLWIPKGAAFDLGSALIRGNTVFIIISINIKVDP